MGLNRRVGFFAGLRYQGGGPMWAWMLHRVTGIAMVLFIGAHVFASFFMQQFGGDFATNLNIIYESWVFQIVVTFIVIFHGLNGVIQREALWLQWFIFIPIYWLTVFILIQRAVTGSY